MRVRAHRIYTIHAVPRTLLDEEAVAVAPPSLSSVRSSAVLSDDKRELRSSKLSESASVKLSGGELGVELAKVEGEMRDVDAKLALIEAHLRDAMQRRMRTVGQPTKTGSPQLGATDSVSTKLGKLGRSFSLGSAVVRCHVLPSDRCAAAA